MNGFLTAAFTDGADGEWACEAFCAALLAEGVGRVETGVFGAVMEVELVNDGPVTLLLEG